MLSLRIAARFLRRSPVQSALIAAGIAVGIGVQVFLGSLIISLQQSLVDETIGSSPQVTVTAPQEGDAVKYSTALRETLAADERIVAVVPTRTFSAIYTKDTESAPLRAVGGDLDRLDTIYDITGRMVEGAATLEGDDVLVGQEFADKHGLSPGGVVDLVLPDGGVSRRMVAGVFDLGSAAVNEALVFVPSPAAAEVLGFGAEEYSAVDMQVADVFASTEVADDLRRQPALAGLQVTDWQSQNQDLLSALQAQSSSSYTIQFFVLVAVALGIASTLAVSAVQKTRQIGILKAMGMKDRQAGRVFLWQAALLGFGGAAAGVVIGLGMIVLFTRLGSTLTITPQWAFTAISFVVGVAVALLSSLIPSRRTSKLDAIEVIQGG